MAGNGRAAAGGEPASKTHMAPLRTCRALALAGLCMCGLASPSAVRAQPASGSPSQPIPPVTRQAPSQPPNAGEDDSPLPVSLDRIREGLQREPALKLDFLDPDIPLFRTSVQERVLTLEDYWKIGPETAVSRLVRPSHASRWHHEFLSVVTPKDYLATVPMQGNPVHPVGPPVMEISNALKKVFSNIERGRIRRQIQEELKLIEANNAEQDQEQQAPAPKPPVVRPPNDRR